MRSMNQATFGFELAPSNRNRSGKAFKVVLSISITQAYLFTAAVEVYYKSFEGILDFLIYFRAFMFSTFTVPFCEGNRMLSKRVTF